MRILFSGFQNGPLLGVFETLLGHLDISFCATIDEDECKINGRRDIFHHNVWKLIAGEYDYGGNKPTPLNESLVFDMAECEIAALRMMDRLDPYHYQSYATRKSLYLRHLEYWNDFLDRRRLDYFVLTNVPHEVYDFIIFHLCKIKGVKTLMFCQCPVPDCTFLTEDWRLLASELDHEQQILSNKSPDEIILAPNIEAYFSAQTFSESIPSPFYMSEVLIKLKNEHSFTGFAQKALKNIRRIISRQNAAGSLFNREGLTRLLKQLLERFNTRWRMLRDDRKLWNYYASLCQDVDFHRSFIYVPLHFQPECTTSPMGGAYVDQALMVRTLAAASAPGTLLYVKEHPAQRARGRDTGFYSELVALPNVRLVRKDFPSSELILRSKAVATITGTAGWEALFRGKPVLMFGDFFYSVAPGAHRIKSLDHCVSAMRAIEKGEKPEVAQMKVFLRAVQNVAVNGYSDLAYSETSALTEKKNIENLSVALLARMHGE